MTTILSHWYIHLGKSDLIQFQANEGTQSQSRDLGSVSEISKRSWFSKKLRRVSQNVRKKIATLNKAVKQNVKQLEEAIQTNIDGAKEVLKDEKVHDTIDKAKKLYDLYKLIDG
ncbi:hypothetical protein ElyMa_005848600 [Elysia marginata]|uniref:Uncharacterized protein n=1 Tax=Elysia marginata TaxID=1093978 RepID=A0AAV4FZN3_9GAST|nr:hypothetical protein ElyMa_005848600 [Elysia marginata]